MSTASKARKSYRGVAQFGRALRSGRRGRVFESRRLASIIKHTACWSSGQDDALSRRKPGFDSRTGHRKLLWVFQSIFQIKMLPWLSW